MTNLNTQEVDNLLAEEEEFHDAIDELEHGIGINESMVEWANINFRSSFGDSGEFSGMTPVAQLLKCNECDTNTKTIDKQMEVLTKQDKQLSDSQNKLKESNKQVKLLEIKLKDALEALRKVHHKDDKEPQNSALKIQCRECSFTCESEEKLKEHKREEKAKYRAESAAYRQDNGEGPLPEEESKCEQCDFKSKNRVLLNEHKEKGHKNLVCPVCANVSPYEGAFKVHSMVHGAEIKKVSQPYYPGNVHNFKCTPCKESFGSDDDLMNHLYEVHLTEAHRNGTRLAKYNNMNASNQEDRQPPCKNCDNCRFHSQFRCMFYHERPPQKRQVRHKRQAPSSQWKVVHPRWVQGNQEQGVQQSQGDQALPPWCTMVVAAS